MRWSRLDLDSKRGKITASAVIVLLLIMPALVGTYFIYVNPPRGIVEIDSGKDTYVSSSDTQEHAHEQTLRISNYSQDSDEYFEIGFFKFLYLPPPGGGGLVDALFSFHCGVVSGGEVELHIIDAEEQWDWFEADLINLTFSNMPSYEPVPFTTLAVNSNGSYLVPVFCPGGLTMEPSNGIIGFAVTAKQDTQIVIYSFEGEVENQPKLTMYITPGLMVRNPFVYYLHPFFVLPAVGGVALLLILFRRSKIQKDLRLLRD